MSAVQLTSMAAGDLLHDGPRHREQLGHSAPGVWGPWRGKVIAAAVRRNDHLLSRGTRGSARASSAACD